MAEIYTGEDIVRVHDQQINTYCDYLVYFDDVCMNKYVTQYYVSLGIEEGVGSANVALLYAPSFDKRLNYDGIDNGTAVRIFAKNVFSDRYLMIFDGIIKSKQASISPEGRAISFDATGYLYWANKIVAPISIPFNSAISPGERLRWKAQSIDPSTVNSVETVQAGSMKGKSMEDFLTLLKSKSVSNSRIYSDPNTAANFDDMVNRVCLMGDISTKLVESQVIDFVVSANTVFADTMFVALSNVTQNLLVEMYQDRDGIIRLKPPFWNEPVLKNHVIDPLLVVSENENMDWTQFYTRIIVQGGLEEWMEDQGAGVDLLTPVGAYLGNMEDKSKAQWADYLDEARKGSS